MPSLLSGLLLVLFVCCRSLCQLLLLPLPWLWKLASPPAPNKLPALPCLARFLQLLGISQRNTASLSVGQTNMATRGSVDDNTRPAVIGSTLTQKAASTIIILQDLTRGSTHPSSGILLSCAANASDSPSPWSIAASKGLVKAPNPRMLNITTCEVWVCVWSRVVRRW